MLLSLKNTIIANIKATCKDWPLIFLIFLAVLEYGYTFKWICDLDRLFQPQLVFALGLFIFIMSLVRSLQTYQNDITQHPPYSKYIFLMVVPLIGYLIHIEAVEYFISLRPISKEHSDIIPATQLYVSRFMNDQFPYDIMDFGWKVHPNYLPMRWLPYIPAYFMSMDYREWTWIVYCLAMGVTFFAMVKRGFSVMRLVIAASVFYFFNSEYLIDGAEDLSMTLELMNVSVYLMLAIAIFSDRWWVISMAILLCALSRFSFAFWVPFYGFLLWYKYDFTFILKIGLTVILGIVLIYIIPFESQQWGLFFDGMSYYKEAIIKEWMPQYWQQLTDIPVHLDRCTGFAYHMFSMGEGSIEDKVTAYSRIHLIGCLSVMVILAGLFWILRTRIKHWQYFALACLKMYFVVFYSLIAVPYIYLNIVSFSITVALIIFPPFKVQELKIKRK